MPCTDRLRGCRVLVTRPTHQSAGLAQAIEALGGKALLLPTLEIRPTDPETVAAQLEVPGEIDYLIFISPNAVQWGVPILRRAGRLPPPRRIAAVGKATAKALEAAGCPAAIVPESGADSEALLAHPALRGVAGKEVLIVRGEGGRELLAETLRARGATVAYAEVYRRVVPEAGGDRLARWLADGEIDIVTATSAAGLENLLQMVPPERADQLRALPLVVVSDRMLQLASATGFTGPVEVAEGAGDLAVTEAACRLWESHPHPHPDRAKARQ
ncbi:MAG: uroporphyrinogen-III synthase [Gammaproteobacteria bacterium]